MKPIVGSQVLYTLASGDAEQINRRRSDADAYRKMHPANHTLTASGHPGRTGFIAHFGNQAEEGQVYPAVVVRDWDEPAGTVNLQVLLDGNDTYWATSRLPGLDPGCWYWAPVLITQAAPQVGDRVHYRSFGTPQGEYKPACRAAIVTEVTGKFASVDGHLGPEVGLCVLNPTGQFFNTGIQHDPGTYAGGPREATFGSAPLPLITCDDLAFRGGTWHRIASTP
jgi:hypothetical protein